MDRAAGRLAMRPIGAIVVGCSAIAAIVGIGCSSGSAPSSECVDDESAALRTCAKGNTVGGVDVSSYEGKVDFAKIKADGRVFMFTRSSDGLQHPDETFAVNWAGAKAAGLVRGVYQYFRASQDPTAQADDMIARIDAAGGLVSGDLPPVLDLETADGMSSSVVVANAQTWLARVKEKTSYKPIVYTAEFMSQTIGTSFGDYTLWVANYGVTCPSMPTGWSDWQFWQDSDNGSVAGVTGVVDTDTFNGTLADLQMLTIQGAGPMPSEDPIANGLIPRAGTKTTTGAPITPCGSH